MHDLAETHFLKAYQLNYISSFTLFTLGIKIFCKYLEKIGVLKEEKKEYIDAVEFLKEAIDKDPGNPEPYHKLSEIFLALKEVDKAIHFATECNKYKQNDPDLSNLIGLCYLLKVIIMFDFKF